MQKLFTAVCRISVQMEGEYSPFIINSKFDEYKRFGITFDKLVNLNALGLIEMSLGPFSTEYSFTADKFPAKVLYHGMEYELSVEKEIGIGNVIFTKSGMTLCKSIDVDKIEGFWEEFCLPHWEGTNGQSRNDDTLAIEKHN